MGSRESPAKRSPSSQAPQNMIAGLISPLSSRLLGKSPTTTACRARATRPATHRVTSNQQSCSSTTAHRPRMPIREGRQAIPVTPDRLTASPRLKLLANIALSLVVAPCERLRCASTHGRSSRCLYSRWCVAGTTTIVVAQLRRSRSLHEKAAQSAV